MDFHGEQYISDISASLDRRQPIDLKDKNEFGKLAREGLLANPPYLDSNKDGVLNREEFATLGGKNQE